jgi:aminomethyltransferase
VGLGARDTLRLEAKMTLYGNDIDETTTVLEADLGWIVKLKKGEFIGRDVLARQKAEGIRRKLTGFEMQGRAIARHGFPVLSRGSQVGRVTSGSHAPFLKKNIGLTYLPVELCEPGTPFEVEIRGRAEPAVVVPTPFYRRER